VDWIRTSDPLTPDANAKQAAAATIDEVMERRLSPQEMGSFA